jgi:hypothetical protein
LENANYSTVSRHLEEKIIAYWHEVDFNWGLNAAEHYTLDGLFVSPNSRYEGRAQIAEFYAWRKDRGERVNVHLVGNFFLRKLTTTRADVSWICTLYACDGGAPQPSAHPVAISRVEDVFVLLNGQWLCQERAWHTLFKSDVMTTALSPAEMADRMNRHSSV